MTKLKGVTISGVSYTGINLADIPGAYFWMKVGDNMQFRSGNNIASITSKIKTPTVTLTEVVNGTSHRLEYKNGIPYINTAGTQLNNLRAASLTDFKFLHYSDSYSIFHVFNPVPIPAGTGTPNVRSIVGTKAGLSATAGLNIRLDNHTTLGRVIRISRSTTVDLLSSNNCYEFNQNNLLEFRFTKTGSSNNLKLIANGLQVADVTNTLADFTTDQPLPLALSSATSSSKFLGDYGDLFIVKNTGKPDAQVLEESAIINQYFSKYF